MDHSRPVLPGSSHSLDPTIATAFISGHIEGLEAGWNRTAGCDSLGASSLLLPGAVHGPRQPIPPAQCLVSQNHWLDLSIRHGQLGAVAERNAEPGGVD
jgi:hypothetical protein